jgi:hypothetical protein
MTTTSPSTPTSTAAPVLTESNALGNAQHMVIDLIFNMDMAVGTGTIYITDGAAQTVIDPDTGLPTMRIVGATDTRVVAPESIHVSGNHVVIDGYDLKPGHSYSILMTPGALVSTTAHQFAGLTNPAYVSFDTSPHGPVLSALGLSDTTLAIGETVTLTIKFSEAVTDFNAAALHTPNAVLTDLRTEDHITWQATLAPASSNVEASGAVSVDMSRVYDAAGSAGIPSPLTASYLIDTRPPVLSIELGEGALGGNRTIDVTFTFSEAVKDLPRDAILAPHALLNLLRPVDDGHTWVAMLASVETSASTGNVISVDMTKVSDLAGNAGSGTTSSVQSYAVIPAPTPGLTATVSLDAEMLGVANTINVTITFSEAVDHVDPSAIIAQNAQLFDLHPLDDTRTVWVAGLAADSLGIDDASNVLTIDLTRVLSNGNHVGTGIVTSANYKVDTANSYVDPDIEITDTGVGQTGVYTNVDHLDVHGAFTGSSGQTLKLMLDGAAVDDSSIHVPTEDGMGYGHHYWYAQNSNVLADGQHVLTAWLEDADGRRSAEVTKLFTVDAHAPVVLTPASGSTLPAADPLVLKFDEAVYIDPEEEYLEVRLLDRQTGSTSSIYVDERYLSSDHKTLTIPADELHLAGGHDYTVTLPRWLTDIAGNVVANGEMVFHTSGSYSDTVTPKAVHAEVVGLSMTEDGEHYGVGATIQVTIHFTEPVRAVSGQTPTIRLNNGGTAYFDKVDGREMTFIYRVGAGDGSIDRLDLASADGLAGKVADDAGNLLGTTDIKFSKLSLFRGWEIVVDTVAPAKLPVPQLDSASDTGVSHADLITADTRPVFHGTGAEPTAQEIRVYDGGGIVGYAYPGSDGKWTSHMLENRSLSNGVHTLTFMQVDLAGNLSPLSDPIRLTVDTSAPSLASSTASVKSGSAYVLKFDEIIDLSAMGNVALLDDSGHVVSTFRPDSANWTVSHGDAGDVSVLQIPGLANGSYHLHFDHDHPTDLAGNVSSTSVQDLAFTVAGPVAVSVPQLADGSDSGTKGDAITSQTRPVVQGSGAESGATVTVYEIVGDALSWRGQEQADSSGNWSIDCSEIVLANGLHRLVAIQTDSAGNQSPASPSLLLTVDTHADKPVMQLATGSDSSTKGDWLTSATSPSLTGSAGSPAEAGAKIELFEGGTLLGSATADASGAWTIPTSLLAGLHNLSVRQTDVAGNVSEMATNSLTIDTTAPGQIPDVALAAESDSGVSDTDNITNVKKPYIVGTGAEPNATIELFDGDVLVGSIAADMDGKWKLAPGSDLGDGEHRLSVRQVDAAGNAGIKSEAIVVHIDTVAPTVGGYTTSLLLGHDFEIWFSEPVVHTGLTNSATFTDSVTHIPLALPLGTSGSWSDNVMRDDHLTSVWHFVPTHGGDVVVELTGVQDLAGNVATIPSAHYGFSIPPTAINLLPYLHL